MPSAGPALRPDVDSAMTRSILRPIRTRRVLPVQPIPRDADLTPGTRKTLAAIGTLWVSFAVTATASPFSRVAPSPDTADPAIMQ